MTTRGVKILAAVVAAALVGCGASTTTITPGATGTSAASTEFAGFVPYEPITGDPYSAALTTNSCVTPTTSTSTFLTVDSATTGTFSVSMVDAPNTDVVGVWVNILNVSVHVAGAGWTNLEGAKWVNPVNLLTLQDGVEQFLGITSLPAGTITQIRLLIQTDVSTGSGVGDQMVNYVEMASGARFPLKTPSGYESGLKIMGPWKIEGCKHTKVTIDFDGKQSIWYHPTGRDTDLGTEWILRPVIRVKSVSTENTCPTSPTTTITPPPPTDTITPPPVVTQPPTDTITPPPTNQPIDALCSLPSECASNNCVSGKCVASGGTTTTPTPPGTKGTGETCSAGTECSSGGCFESKCAAPGALGAACTLGTECTSGSCVASQCAAGGASASCTVPAECLSNSCYPNNTCAVSPVGGRCNLASDCGSGVLCVAGSCLLPTSATCTAPTECMSNSCSGTTGAAGTCQTGSLNATCVADADCSTGLYCVPNTCGGISSCQPPSHMTL